MAIPTSKNSISSGIAVPFLNAIEAIVRFLRMIAQVLVPWEVELIDYEVPQGNTAIVIGTKFARQNRALRCVIVMPNASSVYPIVYLNTDQPYGTTGPNDVKSWKPGYVRLEWTTAPSGTVIYQGTIEVKTGLSIGGAGKTSGAVGGGVVGGEGISIPGAGETIAIGKR